MLWFYILGCNPAPQSPDAVAQHPVPRGSVTFDAAGSAVPEGSHSFLVARHPEALEVVELVGRTRSGPVPPDTFVLDLEPVETDEPQKGVQGWLGQLALRTPEMGRPWRQSPVGMQLTVGNRELKFVRSHQDKGRVWTWTTDRAGLRVYLPRTHEAPAVTVKPGSIRSDALALDRRTFEGSDLDFIARTQPLYQAWRTGLYLPPPATVRFEHTLPDGAPVFATQVHLPAPPMGRSASDGAVLQVTIVDGDTRTQVAEASVKTGRVADVRADLSRWAGQTVTVELATLANDTPVHDHVFLDEPTIYVPTDTPRRILLVLVDTLRADHLGVYGYERNTSPRLDAWAEGAAVLTENRAVAPWTLPSSRAVLAGRNPESWNAGPMLHDALARQGFASVSLVSNIYLSSGYDLQQGWTLHKRQPQSSLASVEGAMRVLESPQFADRDLFLFLHIMDPHAPYAERPEFRSIWAAPPPADIPERPQADPILAAFKRARRSGDDALADTIRTWTVDRYDQNIYQVDHDLERLLRAVGPNAWTVFTADHGERFFTGPGETYEHGQALEDDLVHVPLLFRGPGIEAHRIDATTSLVDIAPTLLERFAPDSDVPMDGRSLVDALQGAPLEDAPAGFGRLLYGDAGWGVVDGAQRYLTRGADEGVVELDGSLLGRPVSDADLERWRAKLESATGLSGTLAFRVAMPGKSLRMRGKDVEWSATRPGGFPNAWGATDTISSYAPLLHDGDTLTVRKHANGPASREVYIPITAERPDLAGTTVRYTHRGKTEERTLGPVPPTGRYDPLGPEATPLRIERVWMPRTLDEGGVLDEALASELEALGYLEGD
jgi:arylsulfatase A-like enzyme